MLPATPLQVPTYTDPRVHNLAQSPFKKRGVVHKDIFLPFTPRFTKASIFFTFPQHILYDPPICAIHITHVTLPDFITLMVFWRGVQVVEATHSEILSSLVKFPLLGELLIQA